MIPCWGATSSRRDVGKPATGRRCWVWLLGVVVAVAVLAGLFLTFYKPPPRKDCISAFRDPVPPRGYGKEFEFERWSAQNETGEGRFAFVTLATSSNRFDYWNIAATWAYTLRLTGTVHDIVVMAMGEPHEEAQRLFAKLGVTVIPVDPVPKPDTVVIKAANWGSSWNKLAAWKLEQYDKLVWMDSDMMVLRNVDELFEEPDLSFAPDMSSRQCDYRPTDGPNAGLLVFRPSYPNLETMLGLASDACWTERTNYWAWSDQQLVTKLFFTIRGRFSRLSHTYNYVTWTCGCGAPGGQQGPFIAYPKIIHFIAVHKPWEYTRAQLDEDSTDPCCQMCDYRYLKLWYDFHDEMMARGGVVRVH